jgi:hypothetical protein
MSWEGCIWRHIKGVAVWGHPAGVGALVCVKLDHVENLLLEGTHGQYQMTELEQVASSKGLPQWTHKRIVGYKEPN